MNKGSSLYKTAGILAIVFGTLMCLGFVIVVPALIGVSMIFGGVSFMKYSELNASEIKNKSGIIIFWIVLFFIFGGVITGVLALSAYVDSKEEFIYNNDAKDEKLDNEDKISKLERLNKLHDDGLLSDEEFDSLKKDLLNKK